MTFAQNFKMQASIGRLLASSFIVLSMLFIIFSISCQTPAPSPAPTPSPAPAPTSVEIKMSGFVFVPVTATVAVGTMVTWINQDSVPHTITSDTGLFNSGNLAPNASFSYSFTQRGTFAYYCTIHPTMKGKIIVE